MVHLVTQAMTARALSRASTRRTYIPPSLHEIGRVAELTRNNNMLGAMDGGSNKARTG